MKRSAVAFLIVCGVFAAAPGQASAQGATWADRGYINVGWGVESGSSAMSSTRTGTIYDEAATITHCKHGLANYKVPMRVFPIDDFPKTPSPNGFKIQRTKLREMAEALLGSAGLRPAS